MLLIFLWALLTLRVQAVFFAGRIKPGKFEYPKLNGWMNIDEAVEKCESDLACGAFTFKGSYLTKNKPMEMYFFHLAKPRNKVISIDASLKELVSKFGYLASKFPYLKIIDQIVIQHQHYPYWSTYQVERKYIEIRKVKIKSEGRASILSRHR